MSTAVGVPAEQRNVLRDVSWDTYERLLAERGEAPVPRLAFDEGVLEIMSPGQRHETLGSLLTLLVGILAEVWDTDVADLGSTTFRRADWQRGFEPDVCLYVGSAAADVLRGQEGGSAPRSRTRRRRRDRHLALQHRQARDVRAVPTATRPRAAPSPCSPPTL